jgi:hypothetical protein
MSLRTALVIATLVLAGNVAGVAGAGTKKPNACAEHVKNMKAMKTADERAAYCKEHADCESNHCMKSMSHHKSAAKKPAASTPAPAPASSK